MSSFHSAALPCCRVLLSHGGDLRSLDLTGYSLKLHLVNEVQFNKPINIPE